MENKPDQLSVMSYATYIGKLAQNVGTVPFHFRRNVQLNFFTVTVTVVQTIFAKLRNFRFFLNI